MTRNAQDIIDDMRNIVKPRIAKMLLEANFEGCGKEDKAEFETEFEMLLTLAEKALKQELKTGWIPIKTRSLTNKEKEEYADLGYSEDSIDSMYDCHLPNDGEEVLITTRYDEVTTDTFYRDEGCYFETYCDKDDVKAWMPKPTPYKGEREDEE